MVHGYWLIKDTNTGHAALFTGSSPGPSTTPVVPSSVKQQMGAKSQDFFQSYYLGGAPQHLSTEIEKALGALQVSTDRPPITMDPGNLGEAKKTYSQLLSTGLQPINFDVLTPAPLDPNKYQQDTSAAGSAAAGATNSLGSLGDLVSNTFNQAVKDAKYAAVLVAALFIAGFLIVHGITGKTPADVSKAYLRHVGRLPA